MKQPEPVKRAVTYLRVSTKQQAMRDGNPEGYSLPTQRDDAQRKAASLSAVIVDEYIDKDTGTRTDKRPAMQALLERIRTQHDVDYVIVFKLDRWLGMPERTWSTTFCSNRPGPNWCPARRRSIAATVAG